MGRPTTTTESPWAELVFRLRSIMGATCEEFGAAVGVEKFAVSRWELGKSVPRTERRDCILRLASAHRELDPLVQRASAWLAWSDMVRMLLLLLDVTHGELASTVGVASGRPSRTVAVWAKGDGIPAPECREPLLALARQHPSLEGVVRLVESIGEASSVRQRTRMGRTHRTHVQRHAPANWMQARRDTRACWAKLIGELRDRRGLSRAALGRLLTDHPSQQAIAFWEHEVCLPRREWREQILDLAGEHPELSELVDRARRTHDRGEEPRGDER